MGKKIAIIETKEAVTVSVVDTSEFPKPPVVAVDVALVAVVALEMAAAEPPPAIMANPQVSIGSKSIIVDAIAKVPATVANGMARVSNKLSTKGI